MLAAVCSWLLVRLALSWAISLVPLPPAVFAPPKPALEFVDRNGLTLRQSAPPGALGQAVTLSDVPGALVDATLAAEDRRFWQHHGVDWRATLRAAWSCIRHGRVISGGSTLTQQLIKSYEKRPRTLRSKAIEALQAMRLEQVWSKERILLTYLNRLDYGNRCRGPADAARFYFATPLTELSTAQAAFLAGLPQAPSRLNPHRNFNQARKRQTWIIGRMAACGLLANPSRNRALAEPIKLAAPRRAYNAPHFVDLILQQNRRLSEEHSGPIATTLDLELNRYAETILRGQLGRLREHHVSDGAVVVIDNRDGSVLALVGSENYFAPGDGQVNGAWAPRSAGSTFKPFTYAIALEKGATPATVVADLPVQFATPTGIFAPVNYQRRCHGPMRYREALANSLNIPAVKVLDSIGGAGVLQQRLRACGLTTLNADPDYYGLGLTIGNAEARLLELANAYACLARLGAWQPYRLLREPAQSIPAPATNRWFSADVAFLIADMLADNNARALEFGVDSPLYFDFPVACKTGTSTDFRDNWAFGYTPEFTVGVWVGNFDGSPMAQVSGVTGAGPIMHEVMHELHQRCGTTWYARPANIVEARVHPLTGKRTPNPQGIPEWFCSDCLPALEDATDYDAQGRVRLGAEYREWLASGENWLGHRVTIETAATRLAPARITTPLPGSVYFLDGDLPDQGRRLALKTDLIGTAEWQSASLKIERAKGGTFAWLEPGRHELRMIDSSTGRSAGTWIEVRRR